MKATRCSTTERLGSGLRIRRQMYALPITSNAVPPFTLFRRLREAAGCSSFSADGSELGAIQRLARLISLSHLSANRYHQINVGTHLGRMWKHSFPHISSFARPSRNLRRGADRRGRVAA